MNKYGKVSSCKYMRSEVDEANAETLDHVSR